MILQSTESMAVPEETRNNANIKCWSEQIGVEQYTEKRSLGGVFGFKWRLICKMNSYAAFENETKAWNVRGLNINWRKVNYRTRWRLGEGMVLRGGTSYTAQVKVLQATPLVFSHTPKKGEPLQTGWAPQFVPVDFPQVLLSPNSHALSCHAPSAKMSAPLCPWSNVFLAHEAPSSVSAPGATFVHLSWFYLDKFFLPFYLVSKAFAEREEMALFTIFPG